MLVEAVAALEMSAVLKATAARVEAALVVLVQVRLTGLEPQEQLIQAAAVAAAAGRITLALVQAVQGALALLFCLFPPHHIAALQPALRLSLSAQ
jgi:hypothetical protein